MEEYREEYRMLGLRIAFYRKKAGPHRSQQRQKNRGNFSAHALSYGQRFKRLRLRTFRGPHVKHKRIRRRFPAAFFFAASPAIPFRPLFRYRFVTFSRSFPESFPVNSCPIGSKVGIIMLPEPKRLDKSGDEVYTKRSFPLVTKVTSRLFARGGRPILPRGDRHGAPPPPSGRGPGPRLFQKSAVKLPYRRVSK